ncbi:hypothetical protein FLJC2902T_08920 [Flavobacterium limnosediminis JC2902]|uniref:Uncharacterized protein n=1 Tax=Flavobacterium limnosediminis JC2902 TaxID=1341181 RepID=V6SS70_9FLAO|nr:hypothetical protein [Flavobacterium limnosediminis]ESU29486.1 hypothetical protein FLJC2902T_08920 [Flavobacterium limnosediminis JC2902]
MKEFFNKNKLAIVLFFGIIVLAVMSRYKVIKSNYDNALLLDRWTGELEIVEVNK